MEPGETKPIKTDRRARVAMKVATGLLLATLAFNASAAPVNDGQEPAHVQKDACVSLVRIGGLRALDNRTAVIFSSMGKPSYLIKLSVPLPELKFAHRYAYIDRDRDGHLCGRSRDGVALPDEALRIPSTIVSMTPLDARAIESLEQKYEVRLTRKAKSKIPGSGGAHGAVSETA
jgi:hypothetical protein